MPSVGAVLDLPSGQTIQLFFYSNSKCLTFRQIGNILGKSFEIGSFSLPILIFVSLMNRILEEAAEGLHLLSDKLPPPGALSELVFCAVFCKTDSNLSSPP